MWKSIFFLSFQSLKTVGKSFRSPWKVLEFYTILPVWTLPMYKVCVICFSDLPEDSLHLSAPSSSSYTPVFRCTVCGKLCPSRWKLETHSRIHTGLKPFKCHICMKAFNVKGNLRMHIRRHETWWLAITSSHRHLSRVIWFSTMQHFDKCRLRRAFAASF